MRVLAGSGLLTFSLLTACASPESRVRSALLDAGVRPVVARCMADEMTDRLSIGQLQQLTRAQGVPGERLSDLSAGDLVARAERVGDREVVAVTAAAAAVCALRS